MTESSLLTERALRVIPGGVNSPVRAFRAVETAPIYAAAGKGVMLTTSEGRQLTDFCGSWGPLILGHAHPEIIEAITQAAAKGTTFGVSTEAEVELAEQICRMVPAMGQVRLVCSGTEAVMTALRLARGITGRRKLLKFDGCYHGHGDSMLVGAGSGLLTGGQQASAGVTPETAADVFVAPYNDLEAVEQIITHAGEDLAAIIVEPIAANMGLVPPQPGFLEGLRHAADRCGALLIFDEVITGFRFGPTSYGQLCGVSPDLTTLGKIVGGGMPIGAVGGRAAYMGQLAPTGPVYQAGTLSGNPVAIAAGLATLRLLAREQPYAELAELTDALKKGVQDVVRKQGLSDKMHVASMGSLFTIFCRPLPSPQSLAEVKQSNTATFAAFFRGMLACGYYLPPSQFEVGFVSTAHTHAHVDGFITAIDNTLQQLKG